MCIPHFCIHWSQPFPAASLISAHIYVQVQSNPPMRRVALLHACQLPSQSIQSRRALCVREASLPQNIIALFSFIHRVKLTLVGWLFALLSVHAVIHFAILPAAEWRWMTCHVHRRNFCNTIGYLTPCTCRAAAVARRFLLCGDFGGPRHRDGGHAR